MKTLSRAQHYGAFFHFLVIPWIFLSSSGVEGRILLSSNDSTGCCMPPYSIVDCTGSGDSLPNEVQQFTCVDTSAMSACMTCHVRDSVSVASCSSCCTSDESFGCQPGSRAGGAVLSDWQFYASTVFFVCLCCCFSVLCGFTEVRRKKKGISFAEAWSIPQAMPILRTWPRRSVSVSDAMPELAGEGDGWAPLSDDEEDLKRYPVAGLVDDTGVAYGFVTSMPQSLLDSASTSMRRQASPVAPLPDSPREPELTVWISRDGAYFRPTNTVAQGQGETGAERHRNTETSERNAGGMSDSLEQPLMDEDGIEYDGDGSRDSLRSDPPSGNPGPMTRSDLEAQGSDAVVVVGR